MALTKPESGKRKLGSSFGYRYPVSEIGMSRTNIIALLIFGAILGYFLSFGAGHHAEIQGWHLSVARAVFDQRLRTEKADHIGAHRIEVARSIGARERCAAGGKRELRATNQACAMSSMK